ncbi:MAG: hypothetical protein Q4G13_04040 [Moraxella sp.]|nr:hypothetical protein [Moraxella sp.]
MKMTFSRSTLQGDTMGRHQAGVALIAVLLFLILIAIAGAVAVRQSSLDLRVATNDQAGALMLNSSDSVLAHIEEVAAGRSPGQFDLLSQNEGVLGYFIPTATQGVDDKVGEQVRFCYTPTDTNATRMFTSERFSILKVGGGRIRGTTGICNPNNTTDYGSARSTVMTQVVARGLTAETADADNFGNVARGQQVNTSDDDGRNSSIVPRVAMHSVSLLPALSSASNADIQACLGRAVGEVTDTDYGTFGGANVSNISRCLQGIGVPSTDLVEEMNMVYNRSSISRAEAVQIATDTAAAAAP